MQSHKRRAKSLSILGKYTTVLAYIVLFILFSVFAPGFRSPIPVHGPDHLLPASALHRRES